MTTSGHKPPDVKVHMNDLFKRLQITNITKHQKSIVFSSRCKADFLQLLLFFPLSDEKQRKPKATSLLSLFSSISYFHETEWLLLCSRWLHTTESVISTQMCTAAAKIWQGHPSSHAAAFVGDVFTLNFGARLEMASWSDSSILSPLWSLELWLLEDFHSFLHIPFKSPVWWESGEFAFAVIGQQRGRLFNVTREETALC